MEFGEAGKIFTGQEHKVMGLSNVTPRQEEITGMEHHMPHRIMGIHPDQPPNPEEQQALMQKQLMQQQQQLQQQNPFNMEQYNNVGVPDVPVSFGGGMAEQLLNDSEVPKEIRAANWHIFHKDNVLTFLDAERKNSKLLNFDIMKIDKLNSTPYYDYNFEMEAEFNILRNVFETKLDRALGFKDGNRKNERVILQSQFSENRQISEDGSNNVIKEGFFKRLLGRR